MKKLIDARGLTCPQPVINTKKVIEEGHFTRLEIIVDNNAAKENVSRFLKKAGFSSIDVHNEGSNYRLIVYSGTSIENTGMFPEIDKRKFLQKEKQVGKTVFISKDKIGTGSDELGEKLMKAFIYTLTETPVLPKKLIFMNSGVRLCTEGSDSLKNLLKLQNMGIELLVCGTCLDYFNISDRLKIGIVSNMYDIVEDLS